MPLGADDVQAARVRHPRAEDDVGAAAGHVGGDGDRAGLPGLGHDQGFAFVLLGVQHLVRDAPLFQQPGQPLGFVDGDGAHQDRAGLPVELHDLVHDRVELGGLVLVDDVRVVGADHGPVGRDHQHLELIDLVEFFGLGHRRPGHPGQLVIQAEEILEGDGGQRLVLLLDLDALLGLHRLVQAV